MKQPTAVPLNFYKCTPLVYNRNHNIEDSSTYCVKDVCYEGLTCNLLESSLKASEHPHSSEHSHVPRDSRQDGADEQYQNSQVV